MSSSPRSTLVWVHDVHQERAARLAALYGVSDEPDEPVDVVVVATPATTHAAVARAHLALGRSCLVEKPLAADPDDARALLDPRVSVGHVERFNPAIRAVAGAAPDRVVGRRECVPTGRAADVDAILDLMVHDLDLLRGWADAVAVRSARLSWVEGRIEAVDAVLAGRSRATGAPISATLTASRIATCDVRTLQIFESGRLTGLDLASGTAVRSGSPLERPAGDALSAQWEAFLDRCAGMPSTVATADDGLAAMLLADAVRRAAAAARAPPAPPGYPAEGHVHGEGPT